MKVLSLVSYNFLPAKMGGQKHIALHNLYLSKLIQLYCITTSSNNLTEAPYEVNNSISESKFRYINLFYFFKIRKIIQQEQITHIILEHPYWGWLGFLLQRFCKVKFMIHSHNIEAIRFKTIHKFWWKILWLYEKWVHQQADFSLFISAEDRNYAVEHYKLLPNKTDVSTYGIEQKDIPSELEITTAKNTIRSLYSIGNEEKIILFNGTLNYQPNINALEIIVEQINLILQNSVNFSYKILICGKQLPEKFNHFKTIPNIIYCGLVNDIESYLKATDVFINPVLDGGGIKTKIVEALGFNVKVVSTKSGAIGIPLKLTSSKLKIIQDNDWQNFSKEIIAFNNTNNTPQDFFDHFYWGNIAKKSSNIIKKC